MKYIGIGMLCILFGGMFVGIWVTMGFWVAMGIFAATGLIFIWVWVATHFICK